jgi:hypothetical protein
MSVATIDRGRPNLMMDHLQLGLRHPGGEAGDAPDPHFYLSLYVIPWSRDMGAGHVALLRHRGPHGATADMTLTDNPSLGREQQANLRSVGYSRVDLTSEPRPATFVRSPLREQEHVRYLISCAGLEIEARWDDLGEAIFAYGPAPQKPDRQRIWSMLFEAGRGSAIVNGLAISGETYAMENWIPWLGRTLVSAHVARGEILVDNESG